MDNKPLARQMCLDLLENKEASADSSTLQQTYRLLTSIEYSSGDFPAVIRYATEASRLAHALDMPGEAGAMEGYIAQAMAQTGRTDEGVERLRDVIGELRQVNTFQVSKDYQSTSKKLLHILIDYERFDEAIPVCEAMLERLDELENHPERFSDLQDSGTPADYLDFARGQTLAFLTVAYARLATANADNPVLQSQYLKKGRDTEEKVFQTKWSQSRDCDKMMIGAYHHLGQFDRFDQTAERLETYWKERGDTINYSYFIGLELRSRASEMRGRYADALHYYQRAFDVHDSLDYHNQRDQLAELATVYHLQEEQLARLETEAKAERSHIINIALTIGLLAALAFAVYFFYKRRETLRKNRLLYEQIVQLQAAEVKELSGETTAEQEPTGDQPTEANHLYNQICHLMTEERLFTDPDLNRDDVARRLGTNGNYIADAIREATDGQTFMQFVNRYRLRHASQQLSATDVPIEQIALDAGFNNRRTFNRVFREVFQMSPSDFRQASRQS
ncbi:MAG: helix-turn-helix transcriptional regulator [Prevotella sp.]|nr:helix-turn-helix transcriptional regulator [Prevotella sp.]